MIFIRHSYIKTCSCYLYIAWHQFSNLPCLRFRLQCKLFFPVIRLVKVREGCYLNMRGGYLSLSEDLLRDLFAHDRNSIIFVPCLNEEQFRITFGMKLWPFKFSCNCFKEGGWMGLGGGGGTTCVSKTEKAKWEQAVGRSA